MKNKYGALASWVYHVDKPIGRSFGDVEFYLSRLKDSHGPILEPAVGNGRFLIPLLEAGYTVHGFDASSHMLKVCKKELSERNLTDNISRQTFKDFCYNEKFSAVVLPAGSIQLLQSPSACLEFMQGLKRCLSPCGKIIVDIDSLSCLYDSSAEARMWDLGKDMLTLTETRIQTNYLHQTTISQLRYEHWNLDGLVSSELEIFTLRFWGIYEFKNMLREAGFKEISVTLDYKHPFSEDNNGVAAAQIITFEASS
jgi:ubiquinone/menaquinone biosynthesis C-methylase UbiE